MKIGHRCGVVAVAATLALIEPTAAVSNDSGCAPFPNVALWGGMTHESVRQFVETRMAGDWQKYIGQLQKQKTALQSIHARGAAAMISRKGQKVRLSRDSLRTYIDQTNQRLMIVRCLANAYDLDALGNFLTAAGTPTSDTPHPSGRDSKATPAVDPRMERTYLTLPKDILVELRNQAVRRSADQQKKTSVDEIVSEILRRELNRTRR